MNTVWHPVMQCPVSPWMLALYEANRDHPRRVPACPGCDLFGICAWHEAAPLNHQAKGGTRTSER
jgi:hypothetical protein